MTQPDQDHLNSSKRLQTIKLALYRMKMRNDQFLLNLQTHEYFQKIQNGLQCHNEQNQLNHIIQLRVCDSTEDNNRAYFNPYSKKSITICYNKIRKQQDFNKAAIMNLILYYDHKVKKTNWNKLNETAYAYIRALHISGYCSKNDQQCFKKQLQQNVLNKQRFEYLPFNFEQIYNSAINDFSPISQIIYY